jgi:hypothetical protein
MVICFYYPESGVLRMQHIQTQEVQRVRTQFVHRY